MHITITYTKDNKNPKRKRKEEKNPYKAEITKKTNKLGL